MKGKDNEKKSLTLHKKLQGKIEITPKVRVKNKAELAVLYTPGVGAVASAIAKDKRKVRELTFAGRTVLIVSNGTAVLGLGNIGAEASLPVLEGKSLIFKEFAGIDAMPIALSTEDPKEFVQAVKLLASNFAGINLEDIKAPECFEIEEALKKLPIPVMHDDQHGTAIAVLSGLINASKVVKKDITKLRIVITGAGAAGVAVTKLLLFYGVKDVLVLDSKGILSKKRTNLSPVKKELVKITNKRNVSGGLWEAAAGADAIVGVSGPNTITTADVEVMAEDPIVFALANPTPEIMPDVAKEAGAKVVATGRSDFPNQINNALVFPGVFRGALDSGSREISMKMKVSAAEALAGLVTKPTAGNIIPDVFNKAVVPAIAKAVAGK